MKAHIQMIAVLNIVLGALSLFAAIAIFAILGLASGIVFSQGEGQAGSIVALVAVLIGGFLAVLALPGIIGGWALYTGRPWGRPLVLVLDILHLANFPIGTALGIYAIWALVMQDPRGSALTDSAAQPAA